MKKCVALLYGGEGKEHSISVSSAEGVYSYIDKEKYEVLRIFISKQGGWYLETDEEKIPVFPILRNSECGLFANGKIIRIDLALPILHGDFGEDGSIIGALSCAHIKFIGCGIGASALSCDKILTKSICLSLGIPTAKFTFGSASEGCETVRERCESKLPYPMIVKPSMLGSSIGISAVSNRYELTAALKNAFLLSQRVLIEEFISVSAELECAYLYYGGEEHYAVGSVLSEGRIYGYCEKYENHDIMTSDESTIPKEAEHQLIEMAKSLVRTVGLRGLSRLDFFLCKDGKILFNEINTMPGMTPISLFPSLCETMGLKKGEFINRLISEGLSDDRHI